MNHFILSFKAIEITFASEESSRRRRSLGTPKINVSVTFYSTNDSDEAITVSELAKNIESSVETGLQSYDGSIIDSSEPPIVSVQNLQGKFIKNITHVKITFICSISNLNASHTQIYIHYDINILLDMGLAYQKFFAPSTSLPAECLHASCCSN